MELGPTDSLHDCSKQELITQIRALKSHNTQLLNIIKKNSGPKVKRSRRHQEKFDFSKCKYRHVLLKFFYLGWDYQGYVCQEDTIQTIEHYLFEALTKTCLIEDRIKSNYHRCGRTDKGVSSFSQVVSIDLRSQSDDPEEEINYCKLLNRVLPDDIQMIGWASVDGTFSARFDCKNRTYKYFFPKNGLNLEDMQTAANHLIGTHDFRNFCKMDVGNGVIEYFRNIVFVNISCVTQNSNDDYSICALTITGRAFLWHQIRCIMGVLLLVGQGKEKPELVLQLLDVDNNPRKPDYSMASETPLNLYDSQYEGLTWICEKEAVEIAIKKLHKFWTFTAVKATMIQNMLGDLQRKDTTVFSSSEYLIQGVKAKNYQPVMKRQLCVSLEDKIQHHKKRSK